MADHFLIEILPAQRKDIPSLRQAAIETQLDTFGPLNTEENMAAFIEGAYSTEQFERELDEPGSVYYLAWPGQGRSWPGLSDSG